MKKIFPFIFGFLLLTLPISGATTYNLPGSLPDGRTYNNIGVMGELFIDLNVTLVNTASYPKFVVVNPRYDFTVYRGDNSEFLKNSRVSGEGIAGFISRVTLNETTNEFVGFWIMPYETVVVNLKITSNASYNLELSDYTGPCGDIGRIKKVDYENGSISFLKINVEDQTVLPIVCGEIYPKLLNSPRIFTIRNMFPFIGGSIRVLKYDAKVTLKLTNVPNYFNTDKFGWTFVTVAQPVIFLDGEVTRYSPNYTMMYSEYLKYIQDYRAIKQTVHTAKGPNPLASSGNLFKLTNKLISGTPLKPSPMVHNSEIPKLDFPVWIVLFRDSVEISYSVVSK
ncbi:hypothetical protein [Thermococcus stetteri]|uniref:hypothetical protein n=1 Tax=Thermococcus stetteri TaxID=49900 RepID=UPI001AE45D7D|nr:hypothetical protein [Thermococcus stetteri]MBP1911528.1 hypothetical protein [Thermococcus stetteri]